MEVRTSEELPPIPGSLASLGPLFLPYDGQWAIESDGGLPVIADQAHPLETIGAFFVTPDGSVLRQVRRTCAATGRSGQPEVAGLGF